MFVAGAIFLLILFVILGTRGSGKIETSSDYTVAGRKASSSSVSGIILGALVGGASTVGTVQMAYEYGLSAWWFTLGAGIGCLLLGTWFAKPLRESGLETIPEFLNNNYGQRASSASMLASITGTFISVVAQFLAGIALFMSIFPMNSFQAVLIVTLLILVFIYSGGLKSYSRIGQAKILLLYCILILSSLVVASKGYGPMVLAKGLPSFPFLTIWGRGVSKDLGALVSMITGVFCTQIYIQGIFAASSSETAKKGVLVAAFIMPPLGLLGVYVGLSLRYAGVIIDPAQALPFFIINNFHPLIAGVMWCGIVITVIGTAAGLSLGIATNLVRDIYMHKRSGWDLVSGDNNLLHVSRVAVSFVVILAGLFGCIADKSMILQWSYLSMGLRGVGTFFPLVVSILLPGVLPRKWALSGILGGILTLVIWPVFRTGIPPLFAGLGVSGLSVVFGCSTVLMNKGKS